MKLYDIPAEIEEFERQLIENDGELTPELEKKWADFIAGSKERMEAAAFVLKRLKKDAETCREESKRLTARALSMEGNRERLNGLTLFALRALGGKIKTALVSLWIGRTGKQVSVEIKEGTDLAAIAKTHPGLVRVKHEMDLEAIKEAYQEIATKVEAERDRLTKEAARDGSMITEADIDPQVIAFWKDCLAAANLPDCFIVRHQAPTEYLRIG